VVEYNARTYRCANWAAAASQLASPQGLPSAVQSSPVNRQTLDILEEHPLNEYAGCGRGNDRAIDDNPEPGIVARALERGLAQEEPPGRDIDSRRVTRAAGLGPCAEERLGRIGAAVGFRAEI